MRVREDRLLTAPTSRRDSPRKTRLATRERPRCPPETATCSNAKGRGSTAQSVRVRSDRERSTEAPASVRAHLLSEIVLDAIDRRAPRRQRKHEPFLLQWHELLVVMQRVSSQNGLRACASSGDFPSARAGEVAHASRSVFLRTFVAFRSFRFKLAPLAAFASASRMVLMSLIRSTTRK